MGGAAWRRLSAVEVSKRDFAFTTSRELDINEQMFIKCCYSHAVSAVAVAVDPVAAVVAAVSVTVAGQLCPKQHNVM